MQYWQMSGTAEEAFGAPIVDLRQNSTTMAVLHAETVRLDGVVVG